MARYPSDLSFGLPFLLCLLFGTFFFYILGSPMSLPSTYNLLFEQLHVVLALFPCSSLFSESLRDVELE